MVNFTSITYQMKREILTFSNKISRQQSKPDRKFTADMTYGMLASGSCLLTDIVGQLHEDAKKVNSVERLTRHLNKGITGTALQSYLNTIRKWVPDEPVIHIDDSDAVKPDGYKFEALGLVRDGSKSTNKKNVYEKGFTSINNVTFSVMEHGASLFRKATFVMDRGYDDNKMFLKLDSIYQYIELGLLTGRNIDLKQKVKFKSRKCHKTQITDRKVFHGRLYRDFQQFLPTHVVEMDTVKSSIDSRKCILTFYFRDEKLFLAYLLNRCTKGAVRAVLNT